MTMTLEEFAWRKKLPPEWLSLRRECERIVRHPQYWSRSDLQDAARRLATEASDILRQQLWSVREEAPIHGNR